MHTLPRFLARGMAAALVAPSAARPPTADADRQTERIGPGVTLRHLVTLSEIGWTDAQVLTVDLQRERRQDRPADRRPRRAQGSALTSRYARAGAVAGVNGDFFDINNSQRRDRPRVQNGSMRKSGLRPTQVAGVTTGASGGSQLALDATAHAPERPARRPLLNDPTDVGPERASPPTRRCGAAYSRARGVSGATDSPRSIVTDGKVAAVNTAAAGAGQLPANSFALVGREQGAAAHARAAGRRRGHARLRPQERHRRHARLRRRRPPDPGQRRRPAARSVVGTDGQAPRTSIGFKDGGKTMMLVTTDGRQSLVLGPTARADGRADGSTSAPRPRSTSTAAARRR